MNTIAKISVASALAMAGVGAHAAVVVPGSSYSHTDVMLFAEVVSGYSGPGTGTVVGSYAGDSGIAAGGSIASGTLISAASDSNLHSLLTVGASAGNTIVWAVMGGSFASRGNNTAGDVYETTLTTAGSMGTKTGGNTGNWSQGLFNTTSVVNTNAGSANSIYASTTAKGGIWDATTLVNNPSNWYSNGGFNIITGLGSSTFWQITTNGTTQLLTVANAGSFTLNSTGWSAGAAVPLPASLWLLAGGLLGLAGVSRRKKETA